MSTERIGMGEGMQGRVKYVHIFIIVLSSFIVYLNSLNNGFIYDDIATIKENFAIRNPENIGVFFTNTINTAGSSQVLQKTYRPLVMTTFALNYWIGKFNVAGYHIVNILFHTANAVLIYILIILLLGMELNISQKKINVMAFFASLLFAVHPVNTEAVNYIWQRSELMASFFYLLAVVTFIRYRGKTLQYVLLTVFYIMALMSKEMAVTLPFILMLIDWYFMAGFNKRIFFNHFNKRYLPLIVITLTYSIYRLTGFGFFGDISDPSKEGVFNYFITQSRVILKYFQLIIIPVGFSIDHNFPVSRSIFDGKVIMSFIIIIIIILVGNYLAKYSKTTSLFMLWFFIILIPTSTVISLYPIIMNDHRIYLAGAGIITAIIILLFSYLPGKKFIIIVTGMVLVLFSFLTIRRNIDWKDDISLWSATIKVSPGSFRAHDALGAAYLERGMLDEALKEKQKAIEINPNNVALYMNRGIAYGMKGQLENAMNDFDKAIELNPEDTDAYYNRGSLYGESGQYQKAIEDYTKAIELNPEDTTAYYNRGIDYGKSGQYQKAIEDYTKAIELNPEDADAYYNRGITYHRSGRRQKAIEEFYQAGLIFLKQNNRIEALKCVDVIKKVDPDSPLINKLTDKL